MFAQRGELKNQYFGDVNDYRKYGILRCLSKAGHVLGIHWMLTPDDLSRDGRKLAYLDSPNSWGSHDPALHSFLRSAVGSGERDVRAVERAELLGRAKFFNGIVPERGVGRDEQLRVALDHLAGSTLIFFDPDNGVEVSSKPVGATGSAKYVYWSELHAAWNRGQSLLVYQHYPRVQRSRFEEGISAACKDQLGASPLLLRTGNVLFLLLSHAAHEGWAMRATADIERRWRGQIEVGR